MNLLSVLLKIMLADSAISALSGKTGLSSSALKKLLPLAIPLLLRYMTNNASSQSGALSLLGALTQHSLARSADEMLAEADEVDGGKIVKHILGDDDDKVVQSLSAETGMSTGEVTRGLSGMAPLLLSVLAASMLSANNQTSNNSGAIDLSSVLNLFGGSSAQQSSNASLLGSLLGGGSAPVQQQSLGNSLLGALLGATPTTVVQQPVQQPQSTSLLGSLLGGSSSQVQQQPSSTSLLGSLLGVTPVQPQTQAKPKPKPKPQAQQVQQQASGSLLDALLGVTPTAVPVQQQSVNNLNGNNLLSLLLGAMQ